MRLALTLQLTMTIAGAGLASAQDYPIPNKPLRILTAGVGGGSDFSSRMVAQGLAPALGQQVIVDNRAAGVIPGQIVSQAPPDGHTLLVTSGVLWLRPLLRSDVPYDPVKAFTPVSTINKGYNVLVVTQSLPVKSVKELIAFAKAKPGVLNYSTGSTGSSSHLAPELFKSLTGVDMVRIPYKSGATEMADLIGGQVQLTFGTAGTVMPHVKSGKLRPLAVSSTKPTALAPGLPTIAAAGVPGYETATTAGMWVPAGTPSAIIQRLSQEVARYLNQPDVKERFLNTGTEAVASTSKEFADYIRSDMVKWGKIIKDKGIRDDE